MRKIFRLELDENGQAEAADFTELSKAIEEFQKATKRKTVFSARIDIYNEETHEKIGTSGHFER